MNKIVGTPPYRCRPVFPLLLAYMSYELGSLVNKKEKNTYIIWIIAINPLHAQMLRIPVKIDCNLYFVCFMHLFVLISGHSLYFTLRPECRTLGRNVAGSNLTRGAVLYLHLHCYQGKRSDMTEKLLTGT